MLKRGVPPLLQCSFILFLFEETNDIICCFVPLVVINMDTRLQ